MTQEQQTVLQVQAQRVAAAERVRGGDTVLNVLARFEIRADSPGRLKED